MGRNRAHGEQIERMVLLPRDIMLIYTDIEQDSLHVNKEAQALHGCTQIGSSCQIDMKSSPRQSAHVGGTAFNAEGFNLLYNWLRARESSKTFGNVDDSIGFIGLCNATSQHVSVLSPWRCGEDKACHLMLHRRMSAPG